MLVLLTVRSIVVDEVSEPEVQVMVMTSLPRAAEEDAVNVIVSGETIGLEIETVTPLGKPETAQVTLPVKPFCAVSVNVAVPVLP